MSVPLIYLIKMIDLISSDLKTNIISLIIL